MGDEAIYAKCHGSRYPEKIEDACPEISKGGVVQREILVERHSHSFHTDAEPLQFCLMDAHDVHLTYHIVRVETHHIVGHAEEQEGNHAHSQASCIARQEEKGKEESRQPHMFGTQSHEDCHQQEICGKRRETDDGLTTSG